MDEIETNSKVKSYTYHSPNKKFTICGVVDEKRMVMSVGLALKNDLDNYSRRLGHRIALGRALKKKSVFFEFEIDISPNYGKMFYGYAKLFELVYSKADEKWAMQIIKTIDRNSTVVVLNKKPKSKKVLH